MELRYYFIFAAAILSLQLFLFSLNKTLSWLFNLKPNIQKKLTIITFLGVNILLILGFLRIGGVDFKIIARMLAVLLFASFTSLFTYIILKLGKNNLLLNRYLKLAYPLILGSLIGFALHNAYNTKVVSYSVQIDKPLAKPLKIGIASDLHLGKLVGKQQIDKLINLFNQQKVDLILFAGDIMDDSTKGYLADNLQSHLEKLKAPLGVYVALGNHDYFIEPQRIRQELEKAGLTVLEDEVVNINNQFYIVGRKDEIVKNRQTSGELLANLDPTKPIFLVEHRPSQIEQNSQLPIDLAAMGHTHKGQIFPANFITKLVHFMDYGSQKIGKGNYIVTSGFGFWGVPFRLGSQSEVVVVEVTGKP